MGNPVNEAVARQLDTPWSWWVVFHTDCRTVWWNRFIPDHFKHVSAIGYSSRTRTWLFFDPAFGRIGLSAMTDGEGVASVLAAWMRGALVVEMNVSPYAQRTWRPGGWCVPMVAHLLALRSGAVLPTGLLRDCLRNGGRVIQDESQRSEAAARPGADGA